MNGKGRKSGGGGGKLKRGVENEKRTDERTVRTSILCFVNRSDRWRYPCGIGWNGGVRVGVAAVERTRARPVEVNSRYPV